MVITPTWALESEFTEFKNLQNDDAQILLIL